MMRRLVTRLSMLLIAVAFSGPTVGAGLQFALKPVQRMNVNLKYAQGISNNRGSI